VLVSRLMELARRKKDALTTEGREERSFSWTGQLWSDAGFKSEKKRTCPAGGLGEDPLGGLS